MFTGIVEELGVVRGLRGGADGVRLVVEAPRLAALAGHGDSISVDGCCLTAVEVEDGTIAFDAVPETLRRTALGSLDAGAQVNLEDALRAGEPFGGHVVQGHVDGVGEVVAAEPEGIGRRMRVRVPGDLRRYLVEKGSVCVQGVSLTVAELHDDGFSVALIPETCRVTTLGALEPPGRVNLEVDVLAKHVERLLAAAGPAR